MLPGLTVPTAVREAGCRISKLMPDQPGRYTASDRINGVPLIKSWELIEGLYVDAAKLVQVLACSCRKRYQAGVALGDA